MSDIALRVSEDFPGVVTVGSPTLGIFIDSVEYRFERDYSGCPWLLNEFDEPCDIKPRHPFWKPFHRWLREGAKTAGDQCVWTVGAKAKAKRLGKRTAMFIEIPSGWDEDDGIEYV